jgi:type II secretory pathway pseudopilin PulG
MNRRGKSLVELLVVISMFGVILGTTGTVIYRMMRTERAVETDLVWHRSVTAFAEQFRTDVHVATVAELVNDGNSLTLTLPTGTITYAVNARGIARTAQSTDGQPQHQEFHCGETGVRFATENDLGRKWATVVIPRNTAPLAKSVSLPAATLLEVRAVLGRFVLPTPKEGVS